MADLVIGDYTAAIAIDGSTHYLLIQPGDNSTAYRKINRNVFLGVIGQPMDISTSQNVTNKTLDNTNTLTLRDDRFTLQDNSDTTKQAQFQLSGITTATTRTYTLPNASSTLADISTAQTFTNKTLTSPVITGGSIDNSTITVDTIAGHTVAGNGTVYGLSIQSGVLQTANSIQATNLQTSSVLSAKLGLSSGFTGGVASQANAGSAGGTMYYINLGGIKMLWAISAAGKATGSAYDFTLPAFFTTVQSVTATAYVPVSVATQYANVSAASTSTVSAYIIASTGSGTAQISLFVIGT